jgi:hypothetical protein
MHCFNCRKEVTLISNKVGFRAVCEFCDADLHVCKNCRFYSSEKSNDCLVPNAEYVKDKEKNNFCEEFSPSLSLREEEPKLKRVEVAKKLFKDEGDSIGGSFHFDSLFKN